MRLLAKLVGAAVALAVFAVLMNVFDPESRAVQAALLVGCAGVGGAVGERVVNRLRRGASR